MKLSVYHIHYHCHDKRTFTKCARQRGVRGKAARLASHGSEACEAEILTPNKKANRKLPKLAVG